MSAKSYQDLADKIATIGGYAGSPSAPSSSYRDSFRELHSLINSMYTYRTSGDCPSHTSYVSSKTSYTDGYSFSQMENAVDEMIPCSCNTQTLTACNCDSRTACSCNTVLDQYCSGRTACSCNSAAGYDCSSRYGNCNCNTQAGWCWHVITYNKINDVLYWGPCSCQQRAGTLCFSRSAYGFSCWCNARHDGWSSTSCWCKARGDVRNGGVWGSWGGKGNSCYCYYRAAGGCNYNCDCESRYTDACNCNTVTTWTCTSRTSCYCNSRSGVTCSSRTACYCDGRCSCNTVNQFYV